MRRPVLPPSRPARARGGFALAAVLLTVSLLLIVLVVFSGVVSVENTSSGNAELNARARQNAVTAMNLALGELQKEMGPDQRVSATAELMAGALSNPALTNNAAWTGVWKSTNWDGHSLPNVTAGKTNVFREWLVSMPTNQPPTSPTLPAVALPLATNTVALVGAGTCGVANKVIVYKIAGELTNNVQSSYAWWVGDEGVKARINLPATPVGTPAILAGGQMAALLTASGANPMATTNFPGSAAAAVPDQDALLRKAITYGNLGLAYGGVALTNNFFDFTPYSRGVLADAEHGGLKQDLSLLLEQPNAFAINAVSGFPKYPAVVSTDPVYAPKANGLAATNAFSGYPWIYCFNHTQGTDWGKVYRYYNIYKKVFRDTDGTFTLNIDTYNAGLGNAGTTDRQYTPGNPTGTLTLEGGPYAGNSVNGLGGIAGQWAKGQYPGRADFITPMPYRIQYVFGMYQGSLDAPNIGIGSPTTWTAGVAPQVYYMACYPVLDLWNPYNIRIRTNNTIGNQAGFTWALPIPPLDLSLDGGTTYAPLGQIFWVSGNLMDVTSGYQDNQPAWPMVPMSLNPGSVLVCQPRAGKGGLFATDPTLRAASTVGGSGAAPYNVGQPNPAPADKMTGQVGQRAVSLSSTFGWSPASPFLSDGLAPAFGGLTTKWIPASTTLTPKVKFNFSDMGGGSPIFGLASVGGHYSKTNPLMSCLYLGSYELSNNGFSSTVDPASYPNFATGVPISGAVNGGFDGKNLTALVAPPAPTYLFVVNLQLKAHPDDAPVTSRFGLFSDPLTRSYVVGGGTAQAAQMSPFIYSVKALQSNANGLLISDPGQPDDGADAVPGSTGAFNFGQNASVVQNVAAELPVAPLLSLAQLQNVSLGQDWGNAANQEADPRGGTTGTGGYYTSPPTPPLPYGAVANHAFGNSFAHPLVPAAALTDGVAAYDQSYYANEALWDGYFFSGIAPQDSAFFSNTGGHPQSAYQVLAAFLGGTGSLPDSRYVLHVPDGHDGTKIAALLMPSASGASLAAGDVFSASTTQQVTGGTVTPCGEVSTYLMNAGAFNVNSVSVAAWTALLSGTQSPSLASLSLPYMGATATPLQTATTPNFPFLRFMLPNNAAAGSAGAQSFWNGFQELTSSQIQTLAKNIVAEVKLRGPFLSVAEFVNRQVSANPRLNQEGALQSAIDGTAVDSALADASPKINGGLTDAYPVTAAASSLPNAAAGQGSRLSGTPANLTQADLLTPLANIVAVRSDTFIIRAYGEVAQNGQPQARAWCEAVVQRLPEYMVNRSQASPAGDMPSALPNDPAHPLNPTNAQFGRRFKIIQFRWLSSNEV